MDSKVIIKNIFDFLKTHRKNVLDEHYEEILTCITLLKRFDNVHYTETIHGHHYSNCCWAFNQCKLGPDTCACYMVENHLVRIKKLMLLYKRLE